MIEYAGHLHDHFVEPLQVTGGRYHAPTAAGFGLEMKPSSIVDHRFPDGDVWRARRDG